MRLLEPVPDWRITLRQVMRHKWFTGTNYIPRSISLGDMMYSKKELCESVLTYMKYGLKIKIKDTINAVVSNRYDTLLVKSSSVKVTETVRHDEIVNRTNQMRKKSYNKWGPLHFLPFSIPF